MKLKKIGILSAGLISGIIYAAFGLLIGLFFAAFGGIVASLAEEGAGGILGFGAFSIIIFPIMYGVMGFIAGIISALLYNLAAKWTGGLEMEFTQSMTPQPTSPSAPTQPKN